MTKTRWPTVIVAASALAATTAVSAVGQGTDRPACGSVITRDTTLTADVLNCSGDGLIVGSDGVTLNLNGHVITGDAIEDPDDVGIRVAGHHDVTVRNGSVGGFWRGVVFDGSTHGLVTTVKAHDNSRRAIVFIDSNHARARDNTSEDNGASGIAIVTSDGALVTNNRSRRNVGGAGVRLEGATHAHVAHNTSDADSWGMQIEDAANENLVARNTFTGEVETGVAIEFSDRNVISNNRMTRSGGGVTLESSDDTVIASNQILHSVGPDGIGIQVYGNRDVVVRNTVVDSVRYGIEVDDFQDPGHSPATGNIVRDNLVNGAGEGIAIGPEAGGVVRGTYIARNHVTRALDDGIQLLGPSTGLESSTLTRNVAEHNGDLGIATLPGTRDGGGNHASHNGNPLQCLNIVCH